MSRPSTFPTPEGGCSATGSVTDGARSPTCPTTAPLTRATGPAGWGAYHDAIRRLVTGADLLLHDAQYTAEEFPAKRTYGHSTYDYTIGLARACGVPRLLLFHHDPSRTDDVLDAIVEGLREKTAPDGLEIDAAREGSEVSV